MQLTLDWHTSCAPWPQLLILVEFVSIDVQENKSQVWGSECSAEISLWGLRIELVLFLVFWLFVASFFWRIKSKIQAFVRVFSYQMALNLLENSCSQNNLEKLQLSFGFKNVFSTLCFFPFNFLGFLFCQNLPSIPVTIYNHSLN